MILAGWYFVPWTLQYFVGGGLALLISMYLLSKNPKSWAYRYFFLFGFSVGVWEFLAFFHRNAPTADLSLKFFLFDMFFVLLSFSFLLIMLLTFQKKKITYSLISIPAIAMGIFLILVEPFEVFLTDFGWSYKFIFTGAVPVSYLVTWVGYAAFIIIAGGWLIKRTKVLMLRKKVMVVLTWLGICTDLL